MEYVGKVKICLDYYSGKDLYSDGDLIEKKILEAAKNGYTDKLLQESNEWPVLYHLSDVRRNVIEWYNIKKDENVLEIGAGCGAITGTISEKAKKVTCVELSKRRSLINAYRNSDKDNIEILVGNFQTIEPHLGKYDLITLIGVWEYSEKYISDDNDPYVKMLDLLNNHLTENGRLFIAIENKTGMKYFNGAYEDHAGKQYSGLNDYTEYKGVRTFSLYDIKKMLNQASFDNIHFYYPTPDYKLPEVIYSDDYLPQVGDIRDFGKVYDVPRFYNFNDATMFDQVCQDGTFPYFSNSFIITTGSKPNVVFAKYSCNRINKYKICTFITDNNDKKKVHKKSLNPEAQSIPNLILQNEKIYNNNYPDLNVIKGKIQKNEYVTDFIYGVTLDKDFYAIRHNKEKFIAKTKEYIKKYLYHEDLNECFITDEFIKVFGDIDISGCLTNRVTNIDLIFNNIIRTCDDEYYVTDLEWIFTFPIPYEYTIWRAVTALYLQYHAYLRNLISKDKFIEEIGIDKKKQKMFVNMEQHFHSYVFGNNQYINNYKQHSFMQQLKVY